MDNPNRRALLLSYPFPPAMSGGVFRTCRFVRFLPEFGWEPIVVTPRQDAVKPITVDQSLDELVPAGLQVERTGVLRPMVATKKCLSEMRALARPAKRTHQSPRGPDSSKSNKVSSNGKPLSARARWQRSIEKSLATPDRHVGWMLPAIRAGVRLIRKHRVSVIYSTGPPHSTHLIAIALSRLTGLPAVVDFRDPWIEKEWSAGQKNTVRDRIIGRLEKSTMRRAARVILNTQPVCDRIIENHSDLSREKFCVITNGFDPDMRERVSQLMDEAAARNRMRRDQTLRLCHAGSAWGKRDLGPFAVAIDQLQKSGDHVSMEQVGPVDANLQIAEHLLGDGPNAPFRLSGTLPHEEVMRRMSNADVLVLIQPENRLQIPGKLYEMLLFRKPILALTHDGATADIVRRYELGPVVDPNDPNAIAEALRSLASNRFQGSQPGLEEAIRDFDGRTLTGRLAETLTAAIASA